MHASNLSRTHTHTHSLTTTAGSGGAEPGTKKSKKYPGTDTKLEALEPTLVLCVDAFANSLLVPDGHVTFKEVCVCIRVCV